MSTRSKVLLACAMVAALSGLAGFIVGLRGDRVWQSLPGLGVAVTVSVCYALSRQEDKRAAGRDTRDR